MALDLNFLINANGLGGKPGAGATALSTASSFPVSGSAPGPLTEASSSGQIPSFALLLRDSQATLVNAGEQANSVSPVTLSLNNNAANAAAKDGTVQDLNIDPVAGSSVAGSGVVGPVVADQGIAGPVITKASAPLLASSSIDALIPSAAPSTSLSGQTVNTIIPANITGTDAGTNTAAILPEPAAAPLQTTTGATNTTGTTTTPNTASAAILPEPAAAPLQTTTGATNTTGTTASTSASTSAAAQPSQNLATLNGPTQAGAPVSAPVTPIEVHNAQAGGNTQPASGAVPAQTTQSAVQSQPNSGAVFAQTATTTPLAASVNAANTAPLNTQAPGLRAEGDNKSGAPRSVGNIVNAATKQATLVNGGATQNSANTATQTNTGTPTNQTLVRPAIAPQDSSELANNGQKPAANTFASSAGVLDKAPGTHTITPVSDEQAPIEKALNEPLQATARHAGSTQNTPRLNQAALTQFAANLAQRVQGGSTKFEIRLDPPELGKVQIRLEVSADNRVEAVLSTHRPEVLADLQRGADALRRALVEAGFDTGSDGLSFSLEQGSAGTDGAQSDQDSANGDDGNSAETQANISDTPATPLAQVELGYGITRVFAGGLDIKI